MFRMLMVVMIAMVLAACAAPPVVTRPPVPEVEPTPEIAGPHPLPGGTRIFVQQADGRIVRVGFDRAIEEIAVTDQPLRLAAAYSSPTMDGPILYTYPDTGSGGLMVVDTLTGRLHPQTFPRRAAPLALRPLTEGVDWGSPLSLAWGELSLNGPGQSRLIVASPDGSEMRVLVEENFEGEAAVEYAPLRWSADGSVIYYMRDPVGFGGAVPFRAGSELWRVEIESGDVERLYAPPSPGSLCVGDLSPTERVLAHQCDGGITLLDLQTGERATPAPPPVGGFVPMIGGLRFSPDGSQIAITMSSTNPTHLQSYIAVGGITGGTLEMLTMSQPGTLFHPIRWLDEETLLIQGTGAEEGIWLARLDGEVELLVAGRYLGE